MLVNHSNEFNKEILSYDTSGGKVHVAIGFGIANSIMVEGVDGNIIIAYDFGNKKNIRS